MYKKLHDKMKKTPKAVWDKYEDWLSIVKHPELARLGDKNTFSMFIKIAYSSPTGKLI